MQTVRSLRPERVQPLDIDRSKHQLNSPGLVLRILLVFHYGKFIPLQITSQASMADLASVFATLLGVAQDAGVPQVACQCENCLTIRTNSGWPVCLAIVDNNAGKFWMIDATPRFPEQLNWLKRRYPDYRFCGILLTHAHIGHYAGLMYLGREAMSAKALPVYASISMQAYLSNNGPWSALIELNNIELKTLRDNDQLIISKDIVITPVAVEHRSEFSNTYAMLLSGPQRSLFYCPDIDSWQRLNLSEYLNANDYALLDATFFSDDELPGRNLREIPHPLVTQTLEFIRDQPFQTWLIHLNHSNPLWRPGKERKLVGKHAVQLPDFGQVWNL